MAKKKDQAVTSVPPLYPVTRSVPETEAPLHWDFSKLEKAGGVSFSADQWRDLTALALNWLSELALRKSARPKAFRDRLSKISKALYNAQVTVRPILPGSGASELDRHFFHWVTEAPEGGLRLVTELEELIAQIERNVSAIDRLQQSLPPDPGHARPHTDKRLIIKLMDIYEKAGGTVSAYRSVHGSDGFADTPFRRFAQLFYSKLPSEDKRMPTGFDEALVNARAARRRAQEG